MGGQQELHDPKARLGSHRREHVGIFGHLFGGHLDSRAHHISIFAELWIPVKPLLVVGIERPCPPIALLIPAGADPSPLGNY
jgi:hypothetical protein